MQLLRTALTGLIGLASLIPSVAAAPATALSPTPVEVRQDATATVSDVVIFSPPSNAGWTDPRVLYARAVALSDGETLLATWENYSPEPPLVYFPIYRSTDSGSTWTEIGRVQDTQNDWGLRYQPFLYELPVAIGRFAAGTLLLAGNSIPTDLSKSKIDVYASQDGGATWAFVSSVAEGGEARPNNGLTPVWEPLLMVYNNQLVCYYSDQRDTKYGQKLTHQVTTDLVSWAAQVDDVADTSSYSARPGMPAITKLPNNTYIFAYEVCGTDGCRVHYRLASDPLALLSAPSYALKSTSGTQPVSSPYVVWSSAGGGDNGVVVLSSGTNSQLFVNRELGDPDAWEEVAVPQPKAYSRGLALMPGDDTNVLVVGAGSLPPSSTNRVSVSVVDLEALL